MPDPYTMAADLLTRVAVYFDAANVDLPAVRYVAPGNSSTVAFDNDPDGGLRECVMVAVDYLSPGRPGADQTMQPGNLWAPLTYAEFVVLILRRAAVEDDQGVAPAPAVIQWDAQVNHRDLHTLHAALIGVRDTALAPDGWAPHGSPVTVGRTQTVGPQGAAMAALGIIAAEVTL